MKFISKSVCCLVMENVASSVPHLHKIIFKIYTKNNKKSGKKMTKLETQSNKIEKNWYLGHTDFENVRNC